MITKTLNLDSSYTDLFNEIRVKSNGAINVNNLESFFGSIQEIAALDSKFLRLPLDEPMFEINANTRVISIPAHFKSNGLSVRGDNRAEIVFFSVDRYFDLTDLSNTKISINWKMGADSGKIEDLQELFMSTDIIPGKVVFGWPIEDIVTKKSGALSFAVEFQMRNESEEVIYNLNTLATSINIKDGLILGEDAQIAPIDKEGFLSILQNSQFGEGDAAVGELNWVSGEDGGLVRKLSGDNEDVVLAAYENPTMLATIITEGVPSSQTATFFGEAFVDDGTDIYYTDSANNNIIPTMLKVKQEKVIVTDRSNLDPDKVYFSGDLAVAFEDIDEVETLSMIGDIASDWVYFVKISDNPAAFQKASNEQVAAWGTLNMVDLYVNVAAIEVSEAGSYIIKAQGVKRDAEGHKIGNGVIVACEPLVIPAVEVPSGINITKTELQEVPEGYSFDESAANAVFFENGSCQLTAVADVQNFGALQFNWKKDGVSIVQGNVPFIDVNSYELTINEPGEYQVEVVNFQNGDYASPVSSAVFMASELAGVIESASVMHQLGDNALPAAINGDITYNSSLRPAAGSVRPVANKVILSVSADNVNVIENSIKGTITCDWYDVSISFDPNTHEEIKTKTFAASGNTLEISSGNRLVTAVIKNNYNGSIFSYELSNEIDVKDIAAGQ